MGHTSYMCDTRSMRAASSGYYTKSRDEVFTQSKERKAHAEMDSKGISMRECRDSENHPNTFPIILGLDVTGSMGQVPHELIKDGLPTLMGNVIQKGVSDASLLFLAIGDHECDRYPLQAAQFESGDEELDMWLTRTYIEGNGGGNRGESYLLAWEFAANRTVTDAWEKRKQKGVLITIGDEPNLNALPKSAVDQIYGKASKAQGTATAAQLLESASDKWDVYHINFTHGMKGGRSHVTNSWVETLGQNVINVEDYEKIPNVIADLIVSLAAKAEKVGAIQYESQNPGKATSKPEEVAML